MAQALEHEVVIEPDGHVLRIPDGGALMAAATAAGLRWPSVCGGQAECGVCHVELISSDEPLPPPSPVEASLLRRSHHQPKQGGVLRLACQLPITASSVVFKRGVRRAPAPG